MGAVPERARLTMTPPCSPDSTSAAPPIWPARSRADDADDDDEALAAVREILAAVRRGATRPCASSPCGSTAATSPTPGCPPPTCRPRCDAIPARPADGAGDRRRARSASTTRSRPTSRAACSTATACRSVRSRSRSGGPVCYVPGGRAAYPSTVLMTAIPAQLAGVDELVLCVPPAADGRVPDATLAAAALRRDHRGRADRRRPGDRRAGVRHRDHAAGRRDRRAREPRTSRWPKREVAGLVGIESFAGPSEVVVVADGTVPADVRRRRPPRAGRARPRRRGRARGVGRGGGRRHRGRDRPICSPTRPGATRSTRDPAPRGTGGAGRRRGRRARRGERDRARAPRAADRRPRGAPPARAQRRCGVPRAVVARRAR